MESRMDDPQNKTLVFAGIMAARLLGLGFLAMAVAQFTSSLLFFLSSAVDVWESGASFDWFNLWVASYFALSVIYAALGCLFIAAAPRVANWALR